MQTHHDDEHRRRLEHQFLKRLKEPAENSKKNKLSEITTGKEGDGLGKHPTVDRSQFMPAKADSI